MTQERYESGRFFLKDTVRLQVDFSNTDQIRGLPAPPLQKECDAGVRRMDLPDGRAALERLGVLSVGEAIARRESVRRYAHTPLTLEELSLLLWAVQGVRKTVSSQCALRTVPSAGARHAFETYLAVSRVKTLEPGLYRYLPFDNQLAELGPDTDIGNRAAEACHRQEFVSRAAVTFFWTALPQRMEWRYSLAAHKVIAIDAGHVCQNLYLAGESIGVGVCAIAAYDQDRCDALLRVDGQEEFTVYIAAAGKHG